MSKISIAYFIGGASNTKRGNNIEFEDFKQFTEELKECKKGGKHSAYFVRGPLVTMSRKNANLKSSNLLVLDGDEGIYGKGAPDPRELHEFLCSANLNHVIYTSHSHSDDQNKFRCVVPTADMSVDDLVPNIRLLLLQLKTAGLGIKFVKEMKAWSQPWFMPYRDDPSDGLFEFYSKTDGDNWELTYETETEAEDEVSRGSKETGEEGAASLDEMYEDIRTGKEYHTALRTISYQLVKDGMTKAHVKAQLKMIMNCSSGAGTERWLTRFNDVDRMVDGVNLEEDTNFTIEGMKNVKVTMERIPKPPGLMGDLYNSAYDSLLYQYDEVALVSAVGVVAGVCGRKFNVMQPAPMGLNVYMTLVAGTGFGKERISKFIEYCLMSASDGLKDYSSFYGAGSFTSAKAIYNQVSDARSQVCVASEAGLLMKVRSGNVEAKSAMILDMYSKSDRNSWTKASSFSSKDDSIPPCRAVAMTIISESTEKSMMEAFSDSDALESGYLPRQSIFKVHDENRVANRNCILKMDKQLVVRLNDLMDTCSAVQAVDDSTPYEMFFEKDLVEDMWEFQAKCDGIRKQDVTDVVKTMATRMFVKAVKYAGLSTVFNKGKKDPKSLIIESAEWTWGKDMVEYELKAVETNLKGLGGTGIEVAISIICARLGEIVNGTSKNKKCVLNALEKKHKLIPRFDFERSVARIGAIKDLNDSARSGSIKMGVGKVLEYMERRGAVSLLKKPPPALAAVTTNRQSYIKLTHTFDGFCSVYY